MVKIHMEIDLPETLVEEFVNTLLAFDKQHQGIMHVEIFAEAPEMTASEMAKAVRGIPNHKHFTPGGA